MSKRLFKITLIIFANLFAFLLIGIILGQLFGDTKSFVLGAIVISILPLMIFLFLEISKTQKELIIIAKQKVDDRDSK